jgi:nucleotide-binding universal stress UspA family protein
MLVLGETRVNKDRAGFIGSVTHEVLLNLTSPVMVAR